jgi:hypothetical protein
VRSKDSDEGNIGETGCVGRSVPMEKLDTLVAGHIEHRLRVPERLEEVLTSVLDRRQERTERRREHIAKLNKRAVEADLISVAIRKLEPEPESPRDIWTAVSTIMKRDKCARVEAMSRARQEHEDEWRAAYRSV